MDTHGVERWIKTTQQREDGSWQARAELRRGPMMVGHRDCDHRHTSLDAAAACANAPEPAEVVEAIETTTTTIVETVDDEPPAKAPRRYRARKS